MKATTLKKWDYVKTKVHDLSGINGKYPEDYYFQLSNGIYYPAVRVIDVENVPEPKHRMI